MSDERPSVDRRAVLAALGVTGSAALAGCSTFDEDASEADAPTSPMDEDRARELAERFAPTLHFDAAEPWFPTDPRPYVVERDDGTTAVDGFAAFDGYHEAYDADPENPPAPTTFYHAVEYEDSPLGVVQYWFYSVFDQFTANFHWHDWEVVHVFVDLDTGEPQLYVASSHSRNVPNNEFLDPDPDRVPRILPELGSHSSTLSVNEVADGFQRVASDGVLADVTNSAVDTLEDLAEVPLAYGLPRDEGARLPFVVPELDGAPIYDHDRLPSVSRESLIDDDLVVRSLEALSSPPTDLPLRETGLTFRYDGDGERGGNGDAGGGAAPDTDVTYDLVPTAELESIDAFDGPQLSFEFSVPQAVEDAVAGHITATGTPWDQPRYDDPADDVTATNHRAVLADRYDAIGEPAPISSVVAKVTAATTTDDAPTDEGLTTVESAVESVALLESDPAAVPTFRGVAVVRDVADGEHRLTVNGAGRAPHGERVSVEPDETVTPAGVDGEIPLVAREDATKLELDDADAETDVVRTAVEDDFAGRLYESTVDGTDAVYVHEGGAYTAEVRDPDDEVGAYRVNPDPDADGRVRIDRPETGKASLADFVADVAEETRAEVAAAGDGAGSGAEDDGTGQSGGGSGTGTEGAENAVEGLERALAAVSEAAERAAERARERDRGETDRQLETVAERLRRATDRLAAARDDLPPGLANAAENRLAAADRRAEQARDAETL